jgi:thiol peroxidase
LSSFRSSFGSDYGVDIVDGALAGLTARAVVVIDEHDKVIYTQLAPELAHELDYEAIINALKVH